MVNFKLNTMTNFCHLLGSATKIPMLILEYYEQWTDRMKDYLNDIDEDLMKSINKGPFLPKMLMVVGTAATAEDMITQGNKMKANDKKFLRELCGALPPVLYNYVRVCSTAIHIGTIRRRSIKVTRGQKKVQLLNACWSQ